MRQWLGKIRDRVLLYFEADTRRYLLAVMVLSALLFLCLLSRCASAGEMAFTWQAPPSNCNGTPVTDLAGYQIIYGTAKVDIADPAATSYTARGLTPGRWWAGITAYNSKGEVSPILMPVYKDIAPADFKTKSTEVFTVVKRTDRLVLLSVGNAPLGTPCLADQSVNGHYAIPRSVVTWYGSVKPDIVFALCD